VILDPASRLESSNNIFGRIQTTSHVQWSVARNVVLNENFVRMRFGASQDILPRPILNHAKETGQVRVANAAEAASSKRVNGISPEIRQDVSHGGVGGGAF
jgi:hypothetical protein